MSLPYSPTSPTAAFMAAPLDQRLPPISKLPDIFPHTRPQSPPTSPESAAGSSQSSPKRRTSDQNDLYDQLDRNRRKRSATTAQVLGSSSMMGSDREERPSRPELPSPRGILRPEDRPQLPPISSYLQSVSSDLDRYPAPPARERASTSAALQTRLPPIVTADVGPASLPRPAGPLDSGSHTSKGSYSGSMSSLPSPYGSSPPSYPPTGVRPSPTSVPYGRADRDDRLAPPTSDPSRSHSMGPLANERPVYDAYAPADRRYSTGFLPPAPRPGPPPPAGPPPQMSSHYAPGPPPPSANDMPAHYVWEMPVAAINPNGRKRRGNLPKESTSILNDWFCQHIAFPYPKEDEKHQLQAMTGLSISQISNWFINARRRRRPESVIRASQPAGAGAPYEDSAVAPAGPAHGAPAPVSGSGPGPGAPPPPPRWKPAERP